MTEKDNAGGVTDTDATLEAVNPTGPSRPAAQMTATPVGNRRKAPLNRSIIGSRTAT